MQKHNPTEIPLSEGDINLSTRRALWQAAHIDESTGAWLKEDADHFLHQSLSSPCLNVLTACEGSYVEDLLGRRYLDFHGNNVHQVGFRNPRVIEAVKNQLDTLPFCRRRYTNLPSIKLAKRLGELAPGDLNRVLFAPGGAEAIGIALKLARLKTGRYKTVSLWDSFHGASLEASSIGGETLFRQGLGPLMPGARHVPPPDSQNCLFGCGGMCQLRCADYVDYLFEKEGDIAAMIVEPIRSTVVMSPPKGYWQRIRETCDRHGALLIFDEIPICLGRTGAMFATEFTGVIPDILIVGKGLGGGVMPIAAAITRDNLNIAGDRALGHYTHEKSPLAAAAALATLDCIVDDNLVARSNELGAYATMRLAKLQLSFKIIKEVRNFGLLIGIELTTSAGLPASEEADAIMYASLSRGLSFKVSQGNVITLTPPLTISFHELDLALDMLAAAFCEVTTGTMK